MDQPAGPIDRPFFTVSGWVASPGGTVTDVVLRTGTSTIRSLPRRARHDVEAVFPGEDVHGFTVEVDLASIDDPPTLHIAWTANGDEHRRPVALEIDEPVLHDFVERKRQKLDRIRPLLRCPVCRGELHDDGATGELSCPRCPAGFRRTSTAFDFLTDDNAAYGGVSSTENVSSHGYVPEAVAVIDGVGADGLVLDAGCGLRHEYLDRVVNLDVVGYPSTDVLAIGERLPFDDGSFDAVISIAVLEHVRHPFECAGELVRVLKPGGTMMVMVPFLQPYHGYPDHYYNMTSSGLANLFGDQIEIVDQFVPASGLPVWTLSWVLNEWVRGLPEAVAADFRDMKVGDLLADAPSYMDREFVTELTEGATETLASTTCLIARRPDAGRRS